MWSSGIMTVSFWFLLLLLFTWGLSGPWNILPIFGSNGIIYWLGSLGLSVYDSIAIINCEEMEKRRWHHKSLFVVIATCDWTLNRLIWYADYIHGKRQEERWKTIIAGNIILWGFLRVFLGKPVRNGESSQSFLFHDRHINTRLGFPGQRYQSQTGISRPCL